MPVTRTPARPPSGSPSYSPDNLPVYRGGSSGSAPAASCDITLNTDAAASLGLQPAEITGQTFGKASSAAATGYFASTALASAVALWATGRRWIEINGYSLSGTDGSASIRAGFARTDTFVSFVLRATSNAGDPIRAVQLLDAAGSVTAEVNPGAGTGDVALGIDSSGNCFYDVGAGPVRPGGSFDGAFASSNIALLGIAAFANAAESADMAIRTNGADYTLDKFVSGDADWCGNALTLWNPDAMLTAGNQAFWADPVASDVTYQDAALTTAAATGDPIGGVANQSTIDTGPTLGQATTADKFEKLANGKMLRDGTTGTQSLDLENIALAMADGFTLGFAWRYTGSSSLAYLYAGTANSFRVARNTTRTLGIRMGGTTVRTTTNLTNATAGGSSEENQIILRTDASNFDVNINAQGWETFAAESTTTTLELLVLGLGSTAGTSTLSSEFGRIAAVQGKVSDANGIKLNAWLKAV